MLFYFIQNPGAYDLGRFLFRYVYILTIAHITSRCRSSSPFRINVISISEVETERDDSTRSARYDALYVDRSRCEKFGNGINYSTKPL